MYKNQFKDKVVFVTGHTGFKGSWLSIYLEHLGAKVIGYSLPAPSQPSLFEESKLADSLSHIHGDIRDAASLEAALKTHQPDFVFHLAAQPLVIRGYEDPVETFSSNVMGSILLLEAIRKLGLAPVVIMVTTDKVYQNQEWVYGYRENDPLGGYDPYSASKAAMEIAVSSYQQSFFNRPGTAKVATVRAGNVIGGGDWAAHRIIPDAIRAFSEGKTLEIRNPQAIRPWQHVLEPLSAYLWLAAVMAETEEYRQEAWNFGPNLSEMRTVEALVEATIQSWGSGVWHNPEAEKVHETSVLKLNIDKARSLLGWFPLWEFESTVKHTVEWYRAYLQNPACAKEICLSDIAAYETIAKEKGAAWTI